MSRTIRLKFAPQYREPILNGDKRATIRYGFKRNVEPGDYLHAIDADASDHYASAIIERVWGGTAFDVATDDIDGHRSYDGVNHLLRQLRRFYPDATLTPNTDLTVIEWKGAHRKGMARWCEVCRTV